MATERIDIVITETGSRTVTVNMNDMARSADNSKSAIDRLNSSLKTLASGFAINEIRKAADEYTALQNRLRALGVAQSDLGSTTAKLTEIADKSYSSLEGVATLYARLIPATQQLGASQADMMKFTEAVANAMSLWGTSGGTATGSMLQLSQAMGGVNIRAQEFRSIQDGMYPLLQVVAKNIDAAGGSVSRLQQLMKAQKLTSKEFFEAAIKGADELKLAAAKIIPTTAQVGTVFHNALVVAAGQLNETTGATKLFALAVHEVAMNLDALLSSAAAAAVAYGAFTLATVELTLANSALIATLRANPLTAFAAALLGIITYLEIVKDKLDYFGDGGVVKLTDAFSVLGDKVDGLLKNITGISLADIRPPSFADFLNSFALASDKVETIFTQLGFMIDAILEGAFLRLETNLNRAAARIENIQIRLANVGRAKSDEQAFVPVPDKFDFSRHMQGASLNMPVATRAQDGLKNFNREVLLAGIKRGESERIQDMMAGEDKSLAPSLTPPAETLDPKAIAKAEREAKKFETSLEKIRDKYDGVYKAQSEMKASMETLDTAEHKGLITHAEHIRLLAQMKQELRDAADPIGAINRELDKQKMLLNMTSEEQERYNQVKKITEDLIKQGISQAEIEAQQFDAKIKLIQRETEVSKARNAILEETMGKEQQLADRRTAIAQLEAGTPEQKLAAEKSYLNQNADLLETETETQLRHIKERRDQIDLDLKAKAIDEKKHSKMLSVLDKQTTNIRLGQASDFFGGMSTLMQSHNKKAFAIGKAAAIAQAVINTYQSATGAFTAMASIPYVGPFLGAAAAAAAVVAGMANVAQIRSQQMPAFAHGGELMVGGVGGTDSQTVAFRATPGETVRVTTPSQESAGSHQKGGGGDTVIFNMPGISRESEARQSMAQIQRALASNVGRARKYR